MKEHTTPRETSGTGVAERTGQAWGQQLSAEMRECIQNCLSCHAVCVETAAHCLRMGGKHAEERHIKLLLDCAQICATSADFMLRGSEMHGLTCGVCAEVCRSCAEDCEHMADGDQQMLACAEMCRRCADSCASMAKMM
jgi:hypothetical protein